MSKSNGWTIGKITQSYQPYLISTYHYEGFIFREQVATPYLLVDDVFSPPPSFPKSSHHAPTSTPTHKYLNTITSNENHKELTQKPTQPSIVMF
jgi:hypothetical protein